MINSVGILEVCKCGECGHENKGKTIDLWSLCEVCWSHLAPDEELEEYA
ncbi:hypothetical protein [Shewanella sp. NIFS-20-20]|nr:hypothetical protein [Shewanella sp. NIFS-20-20]MBV7316212.1 hypothetical protein [Shewanella sp. NIFS-20-20]